MPKLGETLFGKPIERMDPPELHEAKLFLQSRMDNNPNWNQEFVAMQLTAIDYYLKFVTTSTMREIHEVMINDGEFKTVRKDCDRLCESARIRQVTMRARMKAESLDAITDQAKCVTFPYQPCLLSLKRK